MPGRRRTTVATLAIKGFADLIKGKKDKTSAPSSPAASRPASRSTSAKVRACFTRCMSSRSSAA
jgi:hypothetical protein